MDKELEILANRFLASRSWEERRNILIEVGKRWKRRGPKHFSDYVGKSQEDLNKFYNLGGKFKPQKGKSRNNALIIPSRKLLTNDINKTFSEQSHKDIFHRPHRRTKANELKPHIKDFE